MKICVMKCEREIEWMARQLFKPFATIEEQIKCTKCAYIKINALITIQITDQKFNSGKNNLIEEVWACHSSLSPANHKLICV